MRRGVVLAGRTTYRIGGPARWYLEPGSMAGLEAALAWAKGEGVPVHLLGGGSNVLVDDSGLDGLVLRLGGEFRRHPLDPEAGVVLAGAAAPLPALTLALLKVGYGNFLFLSGIPGTAGGAAVMNAGAKGGSFAELFAWAEVRTPEGRVARLEPEEMEFSYRSSKLRREGGYILLRAGLKLGEKSSPGPLLAARGALLAERRAREPKVRFNCGSVFRNPPGEVSAGALIERAGFKGLAVGGAMVSPDHANWIVNTGGACARDVRELCALVAAGVEERFGVRLEREVIFLPQDLSKNDRFG